MPCNDAQHEYQEDGFIVALYADIVDPQRAHIQLRFASRARCNSHIITTNLHMHVLHKNVRTRRAGPRVAAESWPHAIVWGACFVFLPWLCIDISSFVCTSIHAEPTQSTTAASPSTARGNAYTPVGQCLWGCVQLQPCERPLAPARTSMPVKVLDTSHVPVDIMGMASAQPSDQSKEICPFASTCWALGSIPCSR